MRLAAILALALAFPAHAGMTITMGRAFQASPLASNRYLTGTPGPDVIHTNGTATFILTGDGPDEIDCGIVPPGQRCNAYGGVSLPDFGGSTCIQAPPIHCHPALATGGQRGAIGNNAADGNDILHIGIRCWAIPGSGRNIVLFHGPASAKSSAVIGWNGQPDMARASMDVTTDQLFMDSSAGWTVADLVFTASGSLATITDVYILARSVNPTVREQYLRVSFADDGRGVHHPYLLRSSALTKADWMAAVRVNLAARGFMR